jgi:hypothetical protein
MSYTPTFFLRKLDPAKVVAAYQAGAFKSSVFLETRITVNASAIPSTTGHTTTLRDNNNCLVVLHMTNKEVIKSLPSYRQRCFWCMQDILGSPCPVATSMARKWSAGDVRTVFEASDVCCSFECALAYARHFLREERAEIYTRILHTIVYPSAPPLRPAPDFRLLDTYGGTMTLDEFKHSKSSYIPLPSVIIQPVARTYVGY